MNTAWIFKHGTTELWIDGVDMGWAEPRDGTFRVQCMWMTDEDDDYRVKSGHLLLTCYPEKHVFDTYDEAKQALLETATVMYIGGWRGR